MREATWEIRQGDVRERLAELPSDHFHCCVTSPPYWGLRDYGTGTWEGGDVWCDHQPTEEHLAVSSVLKSTLGGGKDTQISAECARWFNPDGSCPHCGARRVDQQLGMEPTPSEFIRNMVAVFREVKRVLRPDGTLWLNMGDCYATSRNGRKAADVVDDDRTFHDKPYSTVTEGLKPKDKVLMPHRLAIALQDDGWWIRQDCVWDKPTAMPESVQDRPSTSHEYIFLLTKSERYFYDADAVRVRTGREADPEEYATDLERLKGWNHSGHPDDEKMVKAQPKGIHHNYCHPNGRGLRSVWRIVSEACVDAHFATFPTAIPRTAILAGTSAAGCCSECGAPWMRETEISGLMKTGGASRAISTQKNGIGANSTFLTGNFNTRSTTGWAPSCSHDTEPIPCRVLEPFAGSGTTLAVARQLKRDSVGIELNPEYITIAEQRIGNALRSGLKRQEARPTQPSLFESEVA